MENGTKKTSKREFRFVIDAPKGRVDIIDANDNELRSFAVKDLPQEIKDILVVHGLKQKLTDDTMVSKIGEDGDRLLACDELWERLSQNQWEKEREGLARPPEALIVFVVESKGISREVAIASLKRYDKDVWDKIRAANKDDIEAIEKRLTEAKAKAAASTKNLDDLI